MLFDWAKIFCMSSSGVYAILAWRLFLQDNKINFINQLLTVQFFIMIISSTVYVDSLFDIWEAHFLPHEDDSKRIEYKCKNFFYSWLILYTLSAIPTLGVIFCRFIYVRYGHGLLIDGSRLLHRIVLLSMAFFSAYWILVWLIAPVVEEDYNTTFVKGKICRLLNLSYAEKDVREFSIKPKLLVFSVSSLASSAIMYFMSAAKSKEVFYHISKRRRNIITMSEQVAWLQLMIAYPVGDQIVQLMLQVYYFDLGPVTTFRIWWLWHLIAFIVIQLFIPMGIVVVAYNKYPEFRGLRAGRYPGHESPRKQKLQPRILQGPEPLIKLQLQQGFSERVPAVSKSLRVDEYSCSKIVRKKDHYSTIINVDPVDLNNSKSSSNSFIENAGASHRDFKELNVRSLANRKYHYQREEHGLETIFELP